MKFHIITIFPGIFDSYFSESIINRARTKKAIEISIYNLRDWTNDPHRTVDDAPFGGGAGMLMKIEPLYKSLTDIKAAIGSSSRTRTILLSAKGERWNQQMAKSHSAAYDEIIMICGRYEGVDERIRNFIDAEISIGDYVLTGGEIGAMALVDSMTRLIPGVLGNDESSVSESHSEEGVLEYPQYTRPEVFVDKDGKEYSVPKVLLSGNHGDIDSWKKDNQLRLNV